MERLKAKYVLISYIIGVLSSKGKLNLRGNSILDITEHIIRSFNKDVELEYGEKIEEFAQEYLLDNFGVRQMNVINAVGCQQYMN